MIRVAFDTNFLVYLSGLAVVDSDHAKIARAIGTVRKLQHKATITLPAQALGELYTVLIRKRGDPEAVKATVAEFAETYGTIGSDGESVLAALDLAVDHRLQFWDALIVTVAAEAGCSLLLSEDMQDGFLWRGVTVANPFAATLQPRLKKLLDP